jgi:hypothetical protein
VIKSGILFKALAQAGMWDIQETEVRLSGAAKMRTAVLAIMINSSQFVC